MKRRRFFIRNMEVGNHLEIFLVSAVVAILAIRTFLELTGYPKLGGSQLHVAHMLWGGLLMLISILMLLTFLGKMAERLGVIIGGIGFGTFIDEVGKFVTQDNNYFFQPSIAIIYVIFILIFLTIRNIQTGRRYSQLEYLMNAIRELEEIALHDLDQDEKRRVLHYLGKSNPDDPLVLELRRILEHTDLVPLPRLGFFKRVKNFLRSHYKIIASSPRFHLVIISFFLFQLFINFFYVFGLVVFKVLGWKILDVGIFKIVTGGLETLTFVDWAQLSSSLLSAFFILWGLLVIRKSLLSSFRMFERSILVSIFLTQVFVFYKEPLSGLVGLCIYLLILIALRFMIERERYALIGQE